MKARWVRISGVGLAMALVMAPLGAARATQPPVETRVSSRSRQASTTLTGYLIRDVGPIDTQAGSIGAVFIYCPMGTVPLGGGALTNQSNLLANIEGSYPQSTSWWAKVDNRSDSDVTFFDYAVCAKKPAGYKVVHSGSVAVPAFTQTKAVATCPAGSEVLGGGGSLKVPATPGVDLNTTAPASADSWRADLNNDTNQTVQLHAYAICAKSVPGWTLVTGATVTNPPLTETHSYANCPSGTNVLGGGVYSSSFNLGVNMQSSAPRFSVLGGHVIGWVGYENNADAVETASMRTYAICATVS